jgi:transcriptional regulator with PAS, ATPase and Fis domain
LALAEGGTLFLDEIGDISPALQVRLLRVLQDRVYEPLGSTGSRKANVRIVAATNSDLEKLVAEGTFRQDLFYRINVAKLVLPPLRDRKEDIPLLTSHFIRKFNRLIGKDIHSLSPEVLRILMAHNYPGNIRELENIIEYATAVCKNSIISPEHLPDYLGHTPDPSKRLTAEKGLENGHSLNDVERNFIYEALKKNNWNRTATAAQMGIHKTTLWRKMKRLNIKAPVYPSSTSA